ncbi:MAG: RNA 2'-phosphotransferase [Candidatus Latescibacterota bacterium]
MANNRSISRLLSLMLRHRPDEFGLEIDDHGFVPLGQVIQAVRDRYEEATEQDILELVNSPDQHRFEVVDGRIRALYGHSFFVEMDGEPMTPPELLYIGTTTAEARRYRNDGIVPADRFYVHLSLSREAAAERSRELDGPVVVEVRAREAGEAGIVFHARGEVVLTRQVPAAFVGEAKGAAKPAGPRESSESPKADRGGQTDASPSSSPITYGRKLRKATRR